VMGILNTTPDSFSDGGSYYEENSLSLNLVLRRAEQMLEEGA
ncbi:MAG TPA: dihydropteroate synthase, partial [Cellvibrio sp.]|nr:dihydropteroate synthase [Cellvibrio sp.]